MELPDKMAYGECYGPAMEITDPEKAKEYFEALVARCMRVGGNSRAMAEQIERSNLGYYAGYYSFETRERVLYLFDAEHPIFGKATPTPEEALRAGAERAKA